MRYKFRSKKTLWWCRLVGFFWPWFIDSVWTTWRLPYSDAEILHPDSRDPRSRLFAGIIEHEKVHVRQLSHWCLAWFYFCYFVFPLPIFFSGKYWIEREALLEDIRAGRKTVEKAVDALWWFYGFCWPRWLARRWLNKQLANE